ncbi:MAG TPA: O-antigen ligase family protein [Solirubrobacterales bacterium]|nr:O-antigen ligase family protein [Solirubrobacterales bacterium]
MAALAWTGIVVACGAAATALVARDRRLRAAAMLLALVLAPILVAGDVWDTERFVELRDSPARIAAALAAAAVAIAALTAAMLRWPAALPLVVVGVLAFRIPVELGGETSNLLVPLYLAVAAGAVTALVRALRGEPAPDPRTPARDGPVARGVDLAVSALPWLLAAFLVLYALQSAYSSDLSKATETAAFFLVPFAAMFALLVDVRWTRSLLGALLVVVVAEALVLVGTGIWQAAARELFWNPTVIAGNEVHTYFRVNSLFWDPNVFGRYLTLAILAAAAYMVWTPRSGRAVAAAVACAVLIGGLTLAYSQSSDVALIAGLIVVIAPRWGPRWSLAAGAVAVIVAIALVLLSGVEPTSERSLDVRSSGRVTLLRGGLELAGDRPAYGYGSGSFQEEFSDRYLDVEEPEGAAVSHSEPVTIAAEQGAVGLIVYAAMVAAGLAALFGAAPGIPAARTALVACFVAMIVHSLAYAGFLTDPATWALLGVGLALARGPIPSSLAERAPRPAAEPPPARSRVQAA